MSRLDRELYVLGDASEHVGLLNCERLSDRRHIHAWHVEPHFHHGLTQIFVFIKGEINSQIDYNSVRISSPALVWLPPLFSHAFDYEHDSLGWVISIPDAQLSLLTRGAAWLEQWTGTPQILQDESYIDILEKAATICKQIEHEHQQNGEERDAMLEALFRQLLVCIYRGLRRQRGTRLAVSDRKYQLLRQFEKLADAHLHEKLSVSDYAKLMSVTPTHLSRAIKLVTGRTAGELIQDRALIDAKRRLVFSDTSIADVAYDLRFTSPSYFTRFFTAKTGETPKAFRSRMRQSSGGFYPFDSRRI